MGSPDCEDIKIAKWEVNFRGTSFWGFGGVDEMAKTLRNGLSMSVTDPLNHKWLDFAI